MTAKEKADGYGYMEYDPVIYPRRLFVAVGDIPEILKDEFRFPDGTDFKIENEFLASSSSVVRKRDGTQGVLVWFRFPPEKAEDTVDTVAHESAHAANMIFGSLGIEFSTENDEHYAYFVGWIARCVYEALNKE